MGRKDPSTLVVLFIMLICLTRQFTARAALGIIAALQLILVSTSSAVPVEEESYLLVTPKSHPAIDDKLYICDLKGAERAVEVNYAKRPPLPCEVAYHRESKGQEDVSMWQAKYDAGFCEEKAARILSNLKNDGWSCHEF